MLWISWLASVRALVFGSGRVGSRSSRRPSARRCQLGVEVLENRLVPTATVTFTGGVFVVTDTTPADLVVSTPSAGQLQVVLNGDTYATSPAIIGMNGFGTNTLLVNVPLNGLNIQTNGAITVDYDTAITVPGTVSLNGHGDANVPVGVTIQGASLNASGINITGAGADSAGDTNDGVLISVCRKNAIFTFAASAAAWMACSDS